MAGLTIAKAQNYTSAVGLTLEHTKGATLLGPQYKHFFNEYSAGEVSVIFNGHSAIAQANYQFQYPFFGSGVLDFYLGGGPGVFYKKDTATDTSRFYVAPAAMIGLECKLGDLPIAVSADWRPRVFLGKDQYMEAGRFAAGVKYTFD